MRRIIAVLSVMAAMAAPAFARLNTFTITHGPSSGDYAAGSFGHGNGGGSCTLGGPNGVHCQGT